MSVEETANCKMVDVTVTIRCGKDEVEATRGIWFTKPVSITSIRDVLLKKMETLSEDVAKKTRGER